MNHSPNGNRKNAIHGTTWNKAEKCAATRQVMQPPPRPAKIVELNTALLSSAFEQYTLHDQLANTEPQSSPIDNAMVDDELVKLVAGLS